MVRHAIITALVGLLAIGTLTAAVPYTVTRIDAPYPGLSDVMDINNLGHVAYWLASTDAYIWNGTVSTNLPGNAHYDNSVPYSINDSNLVVGEISSGSRFAATWQDEQLTVLDLGPVTSNDSVAQAVNNAGLIAGTSYMTGGRHLFTMSPEGTVTDHGLLPTRDHSISDMNESGAMVLFKHGPLTGGYLWDAGVFTSLPDLLGGTYSAPRAINDSGLVVGMSAPNQQNAKAVIWRDGQIEALPVPEGTTASAAFDVNNLGQIVGYYRTSSSSRKPCLWDTDGNFYDLTDLTIDASVYFDIAKGINDNGQIVIWATSKQAWVLDPIPEPATLSLLAMGALTLIRPKRT